MARARASHPGLPAGLRSRSGWLIAALVGAIALTLPQGGVAAGAGVTYALATIIPYLYDNILIAFGGLAILAGFFYGFRLVISANSEGALSEAGNSIVYALFGFAVIALAEPFSRAFGIRGTVNPSALSPGLVSVADYLITAAAGIFTLIVTVVGVRMFATQGDTSEAEKLRKVLITNVIGAALMVTANVIVVTVSNAGQRTNPTLIIDELKGIGLFLLSIVGAVSVVALILAGVFLIASIDESLRDRAKRTIIGTLITLAVVMISYTTLISFL